MISTMNTSTSRRDAGAQRKKTRTSLTLTMKITSLNHLAGKILGALCAGAFLLAASTGAQAADKTWNTTSGFLDTGANWDPTGVPGSGDHLIFSNSSAPDLKLSGDLTNASAAFGGTTTNYYIQPGSGNTWTLTDNLTVDMANSSRWGINTLGTVSVTNGSGTATARFGSATTNGSLSINGGGVFTVDNLEITGHTGTNNQGLIATDGTLNIKHGSTITTPQALRISNGPSVFYLNVLGGNHTWTSSSTILGDTGQAHLVVDGNTTNLTINSTFSMGNGADSDENTFIISGGAKVKAKGAAFNISTQPNSQNNTITVTGNGSRLDIETSTNLGNQNNGSNNRWNILDGGVVTTTETVYIGSVSGSSNNTISVSGVGSLLETGSGKYIGVGMYGTDNTLEIDNGGKVKTTDNVYIGFSASSVNNTVTVKNGGVLESNSVTVGHQGSNNTFLIQGGNAVLSNSFSIGMEAGNSNNTATIGSGGVVETSHARISRGDNNALIIQSGGQFLTGNLWIGENGATNGTVTVESGGLLQIGRLIETRQTNTNTLLVESGGTLQFTTASPIVSNTSGVGGSITLGDGGILSFKGVSGTPLVVGGNLTYAGGNHTYRLDNAQNTSVATTTFNATTTYSKLELRNGGQWNTSGSLIIGDGGSLVGSGTVNAGDTTVESGGLLSIGQSPGTMVFEGNLILDPGSTSLFEINGFGSGEYDLALGGVGGGNYTVAFGGTLELAFQSGFNTNGTVQIFDFGTYSDSFGTVNISGLASGYTASFDAGTGSVTVVPEPATGLLVLLGLGGALMSRRRKKAYPQMNADERRLFKRDVGSL